MSQYIFLQVKEVIKETSDAVTIVFAKPSLPNISYKSGQFLTLIITIDGEKIRRSYSLSSSPYIDKDWAITVKKIEGGKMSTYLVDHVKPGDNIEVMVPMGIFTYEPSSSNTKPLVLIGAGSGITPLCSIISTTLRTELISKIFLIYGCRNEASIILKRKLEEFKSAYPGRFNYEVVFSQPKQTGYPITGRLNEQIIFEKVKSFLPSNFSNALYYVCGPNGMMDESFKALHSLGIPETSIRKESFYNASTTSNTNNSSNSGGAIEVTVKYNKKVYTFAVEQYQTILEAALEQNIDLPYSCQSGMCTACMGRCKAGKVDMTDPDGLSSNEIKNGFILTCVGKPASNGVEIEID